MSYLKWNTKTADGLSQAEIDGMYAEGYVFTRVGKGVMNQTRSFRVDLKKYEASSENRRILRKSENLSLSIANIPYESYSWKLGKFIKDFYEKFGDNVFTANKARELLTDAAKSNFNRLLVYVDKRTNQPVGFVIAFKSNKILHYAFPSYVEDAREPSRGLGMMTMAIQWAKDLGKDYVYLGSLSRPSDTYKLQFKGGEWFDGERWQTDIAPLKEILR